MYATKLAYLHELPEILSHFVKAFSKTCDRTLQISTSSLETLDENWKSFDEKSEKVNGEITV
jgi:hypothetical protein